MNDLDRILAIPIDDTDAEAAAAMYTERFGVPGGEWSLHPAQGAALAGIERTGGGLFPMAVGAGKTLVAYLAPKVLGVDPEKTLVIAPAELREQYTTEFEEYARHFDVDPIRFESYARLSLADELADIAPPAGLDLLICDEAHNLRNKDCGRGRKFLRAVDGADFPVIMMSATLTGSSIFDYAHLAEVALGDGTPLPTSYSRLSAWSRILDADGEPPMNTDWWKIGGLMDDPRFRPDGGDELGAVECARRSFERRFATTPGVVRTTGSSCDQPLTWSFRDQPGSEEIDRVRDEVDSTWVCPDGTEIDDPLRAASKLRQISQGFWYYWDWPGEPDREWLYARNEYARLVRDCLRRNRSGWDTRSELERAIERGDVSAGTWGALLDAYGAWLAVADRPEPPTKAKWFDTTVLEGAVAEADEAIDAGGTPIIWYGHRAVGEWGGWDQDVFEVCLGGEPVRGDRPAAVLSVASHGTGLNLQRFNYNIVLCPPANGGTWEQMVGRTHRNGQQRPVHVSVYRHTPELRGAWAKAVRRARYIHETQGLDQRILGV